MLCGRAAAVGRRIGEWLRRAADLEHWAAFRESFDRLGELIARVAAREDAPATICVLSGDVHHAYVARAQLGGPARSAVYQLTCSPLHNYVPLLMKLAFRAFWSRLAERLVRAVLSRIAEVPRPALSWERLAGPFFGNELAEFVTSGRHAETLLRSSAGRAEDAGLREVSRLVLSH